MNNVVEPYRQMYPPFAQPTEDWAVIHIVYSNSYSPSG